jgi:hypothetical protein
MTRRAMTMLVGLLVLAGWGSAAAQNDDGEQYVNGQKGTYRGRVLDAETGRPLAGAAVVAVWRRDRVMPLGGRSEHYAAREALTDENGDWLIEARDVERAAPRRTWRPFFTIFLPGYGRPEKLPGTPPGPPHTFYEGAGHTVEMPRLKTRDERRRFLFSVDPYTFSETPFAEIPEFTRLFNQERVSLDLGAYPPPARKP